MMESFCKRLSMRIARYYIILKRSLTALNKEKVRDFLRNSWGINRESENHEDVGE